MSKRKAAASSKKRSPSKARSNKDVVAAAAAAAAESTTVVKYWSTDEDKKLQRAVTKHEYKNWKMIAKTAFPDESRSDIQCLHRWKKVLRPGLKKGPWTEHEDKTVTIAVVKTGIKHVKWSAVAQLVQGRLGKQVRERWYNHLDPQLNKGPWTPDEDAELVKLQAQFGNKWVKIAEKMPGRSENGIKNRWNSAKRRRGGLDKRKGNSGKKAGSSASGASSGAAAASRKRKAKSVASTGNAGKDKSNKRRDI
jgi:hypothetical protein